MRTTVAVLASLVLLATSATAQGNLSTQGFGYPAGPFSTRALGAGTAWGEIEPQTAVNPATLMLWGGAFVLSGQYDPEFRSVRTSTGKSNTMTARFPSVAIAMPIGSRTAIGLSVSSFLDRTWATNVETEQIIGADRVTTTQRLASEGGINDLRLGVAYGLRSNLSIGLGAHVFSGENRFTTTQEFPDTVRFSSLLVQSDVSYGGTAVSAGIEARFRRLWQVGASFRHGGTITAESGDSTLSSARIPRRFGFGAAYAGISGATLAIRASHEEWSSLRSLGSSRMSVFDAWDIGAGAEVTGPRMGRRLMMLRAGVRQRTLPFGADGEKVDELSFTTGFGFPISIDRAYLDVGLVRANRSAAGARSDVDESAYILSFGVRVRP